MEKILVILNPIIVEKKLVGSILGFYEELGFYIENLKLTRLNELESSIDNNMIKKLGMDIQLEDKLCAVVFSYKYSKLNFTEIEEKLKKYLKTVLENCSCDEVYMLHDEQVGDEIELWFPEIKSKFAFKESKLINV
ncbi:hypothetical protein [Clostridium felsineum]|uniref:Uncharacterized protein n=1 Tax=Clostridium felsineum TaxID=36839 RepID=A0A1S8LJD5_9CLOT|nr:hypothetical protein [Clostridium felsineum]MCR3760091.1 nucleoside kinase [Clostridium felsineum]URZ01367.1 hypothetical protein CLAUR_013570 [Clostridium felsineum]URZ05786.1 hypothetical protein CLROS_011170 [Clostridium felsineum]URZ10825.1 hypothetical protein CROST_015400 [Clostridium felsineum]URZ15577.1 hypothetical protein CLFE_016220 [Clostridium felsineum DSM 794]